MMATISISAGLFACSNPESPTPDSEKSASNTAPAVPMEWPAGAVLAVDELPILQSEVDHIAAWIQFLHPENTLPSLRRQALTHVILERATLAKIFAEERAVSRQKATVALAGLPKGEDAAGSRTATGNWSDLGLVIWGETRDLAPGRWSGPFELAGRFVLLRRDQSIPGLVPAADQFTVSVLDFPYTPPDFTREDLVLAPRTVQLSILDRDWEALVPSAWGKSLPTRWFKGPKN
jgi:hypothetical protein